MVMRIIHKPVALAWRQRASSALRARAAATLPCRAFMNNSHDLDTYKDTEDTEEGKIESAYLQISRLTQLRLILNS